jgi:integrase
MPRTVRNRKLDTIEARSKLKVRGAPYYCSIDQKDSVGYRRLRERPGSWIWRRYIGNQNYEWTPLGIADDQSPADGREILTFWQAQAKARELMAERVKATPGSDGKVVTVALAIERYAADLVVRGGGADNVARLQPHLEDDLLARPIALLSSDELKKWRDGLRKTMARSSVNRTISPLRTALNQAADSAKGSISRAAWQIGLKRISGSAESEARNVVLPEAHIRRLILEAPKESEEFGLFVEVAAITGARPSQLARLLVRDLKADKLDMPSSKKGRGERKILRREVPIPAALANRLRAAARGKDQNAVLLPKPDGTPWQRLDHIRPFRRVAARARLNPEATFYSLRHSSIMRQLAAGVPLHAVAVLHDTSAQMIAQTYGRRIDQHIDAMVRGTLLDVEKKSDGKVVNF